MDIIVTHINDILRFKHYFHARLRLPLTSTLIDDVIKHINSGYLLPYKIHSILFRNLPECDVSYFKYMHICDLKILSNNKKKIMSSIDITDNKPQEQSSLELYNVSYTKVTNYCESLTKHQIDVLLKDPNVKSINIKK